MKCLVVFSCENGFGNTDCILSQYPPTIDDIRRIEEKIQKDCNLKRLPTLLNIIELA